MYRSCHPARGSGGSRGPSRGPLHSAPVTRRPSPEATGEPVRFASGGRGNYDIILALFCSALLISNIGATKLIQFGPEVLIGSFPVLPVITDGGAFLFPLTYIFGDILAEVFGMSRARRAIITGFAVSVLASLIFLIVDSAPPAAEWPNQAAWHAVLGFVPRIVLASLLGYLTGQFLNAYVLVRLKARQAERHLWTRLLGSTVVGEFADTLVFCLVAWIGLVSASTMINFIMVGYLYKVLVEAAFLPITYRVIALVKRHEPDYA